MWPTKPVLIQTVRPHLLTNYTQIVSAQVLGKDQYTAITLTDDRGIDSSDVKCRASAEEPRAADQRLDSASERGLGAAAT